MHQGSCVKITLCTTYKSGSLQETSQLIGPCRSDGPKATQTLGHRALKVEAAAGGLYQVSPADTTARLGMQQLAAVTALNPLLIAAKMTGQKKYRHDQMYCAHASYPTQMKYDDCMLIALQCILVSLMCQ